MADPLKVWIPYPLGLVVCVAHVVTHLGPLSAKFASSTHKALRVKIYQEADNSHKVGTMSRANKRLFEKHINKIVELGEFLIYIPQHEKNQTKNNNHL